jgi:hypothetical protein
MSNFERSTCHNKREIDLVPIQKRDFSLQKKLFFSAPIDKNVVCKMFARSSSSTLLQTTSGFTAIYARCNAKKQKMRKFRTPQRELTSYNF